MRATTTTTDEKTAMALTKETSAITTTTATKPTATYNTDSPSTDNDWHRLWERTRGEAAAVTPLSTSKQSVKKALTSPPRLSYCDREGRSRETPVCRPYSRCDKAQSRVGGATAKRESLDRSAAAACSAYSGLHCTRPLAPLLHTARLHPFHSPPHPTPYTPSSAKPTLPTHSKFATEDCREKKEKEKKTKKSCAERQMESSGD